MVLNVLAIWPEILGIAVGAGILLLIGATTAVMATKPTYPPGGKAGQAAHRAEAHAGDHGEVVRPDGYIDSFGGVIEESGGRLPLVVTISFIAIPLWWLIYIITNWSQYLFSVRFYR